MSEPLTAGVAQVGDFARRNLAVMISHRKQTLTAVLSAAAALALSLVGPLSSASAAGRTIYVAPSGDDSRGRISAADQPLASIAKAIRLAQPGDTIVVRQGTYVGAAGYGAVRGRPDAPIRLQAARGERVLIKGTLQLDNADYWQVSGINVTQDPNGPRKEFLVKFAGGTGWAFRNAEVWGTRGVSNLMISGSPAGSPRDYLVSGNCIHDNNARGDAFMNDHNIYLMPGYSSGPGVIEHNLLFNSENGAGIKAAGPTAGTGAARVTIRRNTITDAAAGVIVGYGTNRVQLQDNLIGSQDKRPPAGALWVRNYDAAVIGNHVQGTGNTSIRTVVWGYPRSLHATADSPRSVHTAGTKWISPKFDKINSCSGYHPASISAAAYGRFS